MQGTQTAMELLARWWGIIALVVLFATVYFLGTGRRARSPAPAGYGCLVVVVVALVFYAVVIF